MFAKIKQLRQLLGASDQEKTERREQLVARLNKLFGAENVSRGQHWLLSAWQLGRRPLQVVAAGLVLAVAFATAGWSGLLVLVAIALVVTRRYAYAALAILVWVALSLTPLVSIGFVPALLVVGVVWVLNTGALTKILTVGILATLFGLLLCLSIAGVLQLSGTPVLVAVVLAGIVVCGFVLGLFVIQRIREPLLTGLLLGLVLAEWLVFSQFGAAYREPLWLAGGNLAHLWHGVVLVAVAALLVVLPPHARPTQPAAEEVADDDQPVDDEPEPDDPDQDPANPPDQPDQPEVDQAERMEVLTRLQEAQLDENQTDPLMPSHQVWRLRGLEELGLDEAKLEALQISPGDVGVRAFK